MDNLIKFLISFSAFIVFSHLNSKIWRKIFQGRGFSIILFPGVVLHELSHFFACIITFAKVKEVKLFSMKGGYVRHKKPKLPIIGMLIISFAPLIGGVLFLHLIYNLVGLRLPELAFNLSFLESLQDIFLKNWQNYIFWITIYLSVSVIITMIPSKKDFQNSFFGLFVLFLIIALSLEVGLITDIGVISNLTSVVGFVLVISILVSIPSFSLFLMKSLIKNIF